MPRKLAPTMNGSDFIDAITRRTILFVWVV